MKSIPFTIAPPGADQVNLQFSSFVTESAFDTLWIFDGPTVNAPLIGAYDGNNSPGNLTSTGTSITLRFKSDGATRASGWEMIYQCVQDTTPQLGVNVQANAKDIYCYPNPASNVIWVQMAEPVDQVQLIDASRQVLQIVRQPGNVFQWDVSGLRAGIYLLRAGNYHCKLVIAR